jgi:hypothetical protein
VRELLGLLGAVVIAISAAYYVADVVRGTTRPQRTSWLVWATTGALGAGTAAAGGAGPGAYAAIVDGAACAVTFLLCLLPRFGKPGGRRSDVALGAVALGGVGLWQWGPISTGAAAAMAVAVDAVALWPTLREAWQQPQLESLPSWLADVAGNACCLVAVTQLSLGAVAFPAFLVAAASAVSAVLLVRRRTPRPAVLPVALPAAR